MKVRASKVAEVMGVKVLTIFSFFAQFVVKDSVWIIEEPGKDFVIMLTPRFPLFIFLAMFLRSVCWLKLSRWSNVTTSVSTEAFKSA